jgi:hypothetical protein
MNQPTVESLFGTNAGIVWKTLNQNGPSNLSSLVKSTSLSREEVFGALGWLGREDKILVEQKGRAMVFSLRDEEASLVVPEETAVKPALKPKSNRRKTKPPKKSKMARKVRVPVKQSDRMEEFLLH